MRLKVCAYGTSPARGIQKMTSSSSGEEVFYTKYMLNGINGNHTKLNLICLYGSVFRLLGVNQMTQSHDGMMVDHPRSGESHHLFNPLSFL